MFVGSGAAYPRLEASLPGIIPPAPTVAIAEGKGEMAGVTVGPAPAGERPPVRPAQFHEVCGRCERLRAVLVTAHGGARAARRRGLSGGARGLERSALGGGWREGDAGHATAKREALEELLRFGAGLFGGRVKHRALLGSLGVGLVLGGLPGLSPALRLGPRLGSPREPGPLCIGSRGDSRRFPGGLCRSPGPRSGRFAPVLAVGGGGVTLRGALRRRRGPGSRAGRRVC